jgi:endoglucanase
VTRGFDRRAAPAQAGRRETLRRLGAGAAGALCASLAAAQAPAPATAAGALPGLRKGLNLTHWFEYERGQAVTAAEMRLMRQWGLDHVRIPLDPVACGWPLPFNGAVPFLPALRAAVDAALAAGLECVVDLHLEPQTKHEVEERPAAERATIGLWSQLARALADLPRDKVAFEVLNEPQYYGRRAWRWPAFQRRLLQAVREHAPQHLVLLSGNEGGSFAGLKQLPLEADPALAYVVHYYAPYLFTHQGAHWMDTRYTTAGLHQGVIYPSALQSSRPARLTRVHPRAAQEMSEYIAQDWGPARVRADLAPVGAYARQHGLRLSCNEFGVMRAHADVASRYRWITDVRSALEAEGIGWTLWDYTDIFGITVESAQQGKAGLRTVDPEAIPALGLRPALATPGRS